MALIEKLQEIKTKIESGAGGGGDVDLGTITTWYGLFYGGRFLGNFELMKKSSGTITSMDSAFFNACTNSEFQNEDLVYDFNDVDLSQCTTFGNAFRANATAWTLYGSVLNFDMSGNTGSGAYTFYNCGHIKRLTFKGSFGGNTTNSSLTLALRDLGLDHDGMVELFNTIKENTNGNTRILQISSTIYNTLTEDELAIATNKGYTITK